MGLRKIPIINTSNWVIYGPFFLFTTPTPIPSDSCVSESVTDSVVVLPEDECGVSGCVLLQAGAGEGGGEGAGATGRVCSRPL